jgi:hypothetical protein
MHLISKKDIGQPTIAIMFCYRMEISLQGHFVAKDGALNVAELKQLN